MFMMLSNQYNLESANMNDVEYEYIYLKCGKCSESKFEFSVSMLSLKGEVDCICPYCAHTTRVELLENKVTIFLQE
ncbi:hypothetical protein A8139_14970 [Marinomonas primoryensis]|uniref:Uncharacterized protein n=1 Tax=Marinomonas primoryensis TaxID=178399 RepID=A0A2Z4PU46_9GAMM|nr:hypothetical protein A8139_14970 [Marinomonas primoryensis]